jgi:hypothetical protein
VERYGKLSKTSTRLGLQVTVMVLAPLELLNRRLKSKTETVDGMIECVNLVVNELSQLRCDNTFDDLISKCTADAEEL